MNRSVPLAALGVLLWVCSVNVSKQDGAVVQPQNDNAKLVEEATSRFHRLLSAGEYGEACNMMLPGVIRACPDALAAQQQKLGPVREVLSTRVSWSLQEKDWHNVRREVRCVAGGMTEYFRWKLATGGTVQLASYRTEPWSPSTQ